MQTTGGAALDSITLAPPVVAWPGAVACGGRSASPGQPGHFTGTPAGTYTITVSATSGSITRTLNVTLVVN